MRVLELFCGTKSIGKVFENNGHKVISVDIDKKFNPTILSDILDFDYKKYDVGAFDYIHASPPCNDYSSLNFFHPHKSSDLTYADSLVKKSLEIIDYLKPKYWTIENPFSGKLKTRPFMLERNLPYFDIDYCRYGFSYRKRTRIWSNIKKDNTFCLGRGKCPAMEGRKHKQGARGGGGNKLVDRYRIPEKFVKEIYNYILF